MTLLCDASGTRIDALMSRLFEPEKAVDFTSFSTNFTFFFTIALKTATIFTKTQKIRISAVKVIYCYSCVSRTLKCNACSRHDVTLRRAKYQKRTTIVSKPPIAQKRAWLSRTFFQATCSKLIHADNISF